MTHYPHPPSRAQNGSILVQFALLAVVLIAILGTVQIGYMYSAKRDLQRIADMAALESANAITNHTTCSDAKYAGNQSLSAQWPLGVTAQSGFSEMIECGSWTRANGFKNTGPFNAAKVTVSGESLQLLPFTGNRTITATATAAIANDPIAAFSLGSGVARLKDGLLNQLLSFLLGTNIELSAVDYEGLANANVNLLGLANALDLDVGTYKKLVGAKVDLKQLLSTTIDVAKNSSTSDTIEVGLKALGKLINIPLGIDLDKTYINLLKVDNQKGLLDLGLNQNAPSTALQADVSVLNILTTALQVANHDSAAALQTTVKLGFLAEATIALKVIEPPVIAVGKAGKDASGKYLTTAHTGQVRLQLNLKALSGLNEKGDLLHIPLVARISVPSGSLIELPVYVEVGSADARLESISCHYYGHNTHKVTIGAKPGIAYVFLGHVPEAFTNTSANWDSLAKKSFNLLDILIKVPLLATEVPVKVQAKLNLAVENTDLYQEIVFKYPIPTDSKNDDLIKRVGSEKFLGASIGKAINEKLLDLKLETDGLKIVGIDFSFLSEIVDGTVSVLTAILKSLLSLLSNILTPILSLVDSILGPLLTALGLQIGYADVQLLNAECTSAQLVN